MTMLALGFAGWSAFSTMGCSPRGASPSVVVSTDSTGSASFALQLDPGVSLSLVSYTITGPNAFSKSDSIDVSHSSTINFTVGGLPAGLGYHITLMSTGSDGTTSCTGSGNFDVGPHMTAMVTIALDCHETPKTGSVQVNGTTNVCPVIDGVSANPGEVLVGSNIALGVMAHDSDMGPSPLSYQWQATGGTLSSATAQNPTFTCQTPGTAQLAVKVSDGDPQASCADTLTMNVTCTGNVTGVVTSALFVPGSPTDPTVQGGYWQGAKVCSDANDNGKCDSGEASTTTDASGHFSLLTLNSAPVIADVGTTAVNTANGSSNPSRNVLRTAAAQLTDQGANVVISGASTEVVRQMEANSSTYATEKANLATRLGVGASSVLADATAMAPGADKVSRLREEVVLAGRFTYAVTKLDRGDLYPDRLAVPGGDPEITGMAGVTPATATTPETRSPITFHQAEQAAFNIEGIPRYDHIFIIMLENKSTQAVVGSTFAPKINGYIAAGNFADGYYATGNPSEPNYTALGGADDFGIIDDMQWNCDAGTGANAVQDLPLPTNAVMGLGSSPFTATCSSSNHANHNITNKPNLFNALTAAGMTWRTYSESMNPGQDFRTDSVADSAVTATDHVYPPGTLNGNTSPIGDPTLQLTLPAGLYKTKHHPGMAYQNVRSAPEFKYSNRTLGGGQWDGVLTSSTKYAVPPGYNVDQFNSDLASGNVGNLNFVIPDQCDDMHSIGVTGKNGMNATGTASDCSNIGNNQPVATGGNILTRGDNYTDWLITHIKGSPLWMNQQKKVAIVIMFDEGNATTAFNSCCGWKAGKTAADAPLVQSGSSFIQDTSVVAYGSGNQGHGKSIFVVLSNQAGAPTGIKDTDAYSHFSFVRTLQDMFGISDPKSDASYMNRSKYTEKFIAQNILNLPEFASSADTHFDAVRPMNHAFVIPAGYVQKSTADDAAMPQTGPDANQKNIWSLK
jgi:hypothetical protein